MSLPATERSKTKEAVPSQDFLLYAAFIYLISNQFLFTCTRFADWGGQYGLFDIFAYVMEFVLLDYCIYGIVTEKDTRIRVILGIITLCGALCDGDEVRTLCLMAVAMRGRPMKRIVRIWFITISALFVMTIISSFLGIVDFNVNFGNQYEFGMIWHTDFGYTCLFLLMAYVVLRDGLLRYYEYILLTAVTFLMFYFTRAKNATICMLLFLVLIFLSGLYDRLLPLSGSEGADGRLQEIRGKCDRVIGALEKYCLDYVYIIGAMLFGIALLCIDQLQALVDATLYSFNTYTARLRFSWEVLHNPVTPFGQYFYEGQDPFFMVDQFYSRLFVRHGAVLFVIVLAMLTYAMKKARKEKKRAVYIALLVLALFSQTDPQVIDCARDFIFPAIFAVF